MGGPADHPNRRHGDPFMKTYGAQVRGLADQRMAFLNYVNEEFSARDYRLHDLLRTIVQSDAFSRIAMPAAAELQQVVSSEIADSVGIDRASGEGR